MDTKARIKAPDIEMGVLGGLGMAISIFVINLTGGFHEALRAGFVQFVYSFFVITLNTAMCRWYARRNIVVSVMLPTIVTTLLVYVLHYINRSPEPLLSAGWSFLMAISGLTIQAYRFRTTHETIFTLCKNYFNKYFGKKK